MFDEACARFFQGNVYNTFNEFIYHLILTFVTSWKYGMSQMQYQFEWSYKQVQAKNEKNFSNLSLLFLYQDLFVKKFDTNEANEHEITDYREVFRKTYDFVAENFIFLCEIRE